MATPSSTSSASRSPISTVPQTYRMHVSQRYLDLTKQKLEITRLPREPPTAEEQWNFGVSKPDLEPIIDHWVENYDWRGQETFFNDTLPQFRIGINGTRLHFVHRRSPNPNAIPLLFCHGWPESFIAVSHMIEALSNPTSTSARGDENIPSFHVVAPSIPGFGFTDPVSEIGNNFATTAELFDSLMKALGYNHYIAQSDSEWGFRICRMIALTHSESCMAIHTANADVPQPRPNFGYASQDPMGFPMHSPGNTPPSPQTPSSSSQQTERPQTIAYALCDSPAGLLAYVMDAIRPYARVSTPARSPALERSSSAPSSPSRYAWSPTALISWTMIYWLPGPETPLRWLANSTPLLSMLWNTHSNVPLAISQFAGTNSPATPPVWAEAYHRIAFMRRRTGLARFPAWERPAEMVHDLRELASLLSNTMFGAY